MEIGYISKRLRPVLVGILLIQGVLLTSLFGYRSWKDSSETCIKCHSDKKRLEASGASWAYVTPGMVEKESRHPNIQCRDCHLGDGRAMEPEKAHSGMLRMLVISNEGKVMPRKEGYPGPLRMSGDDLMFALFPKVEMDGDLYMLPEVRNILWHDRDPLTLGFDPGIAEKTCGKSGCHPAELDQFRKTIMGRNYRQRTMKTWIEPYGPHNCGPSFADIPPPDSLDKAAFDYRNTAKIMKNLNVPFTREQAEDKQKFCNVCHAGCLDCHYTPSDKEGRHSFTRKPTSLSCSGYGRGASTCHPGAMTSRRGETYIGGAYSIPQGMPGDIHYSKGIDCVDCHPTGEKGMGDMERKASCQDCHIEAEEATARGVHKNLDCATCHISALGGYQITIWGPGEVAGMKNPFHKYSLYYGVQKPPIIMKDQKGRWMPVKVWPHSVGNIKQDVPPSGEIKFRWPDGQTRDAYYIVGTFDDLPENNKHLLWVELEQASHPFGKARSCGSCHDSEGQESFSTWEFYDYDGSEPFTGSHRIVGDSNGLRFMEMKNITPVKPLPGSKLTDFASWLYLKDRWVVPGDFSIKADRGKYSKYLNYYRTIKDDLHALSGRPSDPKEKRRLQQLRETAFHDLKTGLKIVTGH